MTRKELVDRLEKIKDGMDTDFLYTKEIDAIVDDITDLQWKVNTEGIKIEVN